jgi:hypothetical protein
MRRSILTGAALLSLAAVPAAAAADGPLLHPSRDVAVVYHVEGTPAAGGPAQIHTIRMFWGDGGEALRVELDTQPVVALIDFKRQRMEMLLPTKQVVLDAPLDSRLVPGFVIPPGATAKRAGGDTVAGQGCTVWNLSGPQGGGTACVTADGVVLRAEGSAAHQGAGRLEATSVTYAPQPASLFVPPPGFRRMDLKPPRQ